MDLRSFVEKFGSNVLKSAQSRMVLVGLICFLVTGAPPAFHLFCLETSRKTCGLVGVNKKTKNF